MSEKPNQAAKSACRTMTIEGRKVTLSFNKEHNQDLAKQIKTTLIDGYIRNNNIPPCEMRA